MSFQTFNIDIAKVLVVATFAALPLLSGCAMCCSPYDYHYPTYGGKWERTDREWGSVGSILSGAGVPDGGHVAGAAGQVPVSGPTIVHENGNSIPYPEETTQGGVYDYNPSPGVEVIQ